MQAPASTLDPRSGLPERDIPPELEAVCVRACATKRAERYRPARRTTSARWRFRELGRAIALTPDDPEALAPLVRLLTQPPKAAAGGPRDHRSLYAWLAAAEMPRIALAYSASWLIFFPLQVAMASATGSSRRGSRGSRWPRPRCSTVRSS